MRFSSLFGHASQPSRLPIGPGPGPSQPPIAPDSSAIPTPAPAPIGTCRDLSGPIGPKIDIPQRAWFLPTQLRWLEDGHHLKLWEKSRQVGATITDALDSVLKVCYRDAKFDVWVSSRDEAQSRLYLDDCKGWAKILNVAAEDLGSLLLDKKSNSSAFVLQFANGRRIYCLSSSPDALVGKRGHVKLDEFAVHENQRELYKIAKPVCQWGGTLSIISTHRGPNTLFNQLIRDIVHNGNPMGWHHYKYTIQQAVAEGLVPPMNEKSGRNETDQEFLRRTEAECIDKDQWNREYCCIPSDETTAFLSHDLITSCEDPALKLLTTDELIAWLATPAGHDAELYLGMDVSRVNLCVLDLGLKQAGIVRDLLRVELNNQPFPVQEQNLYRLLALPQLRRACIDHNGNGMELSERARDRFGSKVEPVHTSAPVQQKLAFALRADFESRAVVISADPKLRADLHALNKEITPSGNIRIEGQTDDSHCDRFWAKALRQEAARTRAEEPWALLC